MASEITESGEGERARNRGCGEEQNIGSRSLSDQRSPLLDSETMLLIDHHQAKALKGDAFLKESMGTHYQPETAIGEPSPAFGLLGVGKPTEQELRTDLEWREQFGQRGSVLFRQQLGGSHECRLIAVLQGEQHGKQCDDRLPGPHVAHENSMHSLRRGHVGRDLPDRALLIGRELPGKRLG